MAEKLIITDTNLKNIGDAIRTATNTTSAIKLTDMPSKITALSSQDATASSGDLLYGKTAYVKGSKITGTIPVKTKDNVTSSEATVTIPSGYYASNVSKSITSGSATTPATTITANPTITIDSKGLITSNTSASKSVTPTISKGYVSSGTAGTIAVSGNATKQLTTKGATTYTPTTTDQTISSGTYLTGTQTIKGDTNLKASNIKKGATIFGVTGTSNEGINPSGNINITNTNSTDVTNYATAQVVDESLIAENIRYGATILGVKGTFSLVNSVSEGAYAYDVKEGLKFYKDGQEFTGTAKEYFNKDVTITKNNVKGSYGFYPSGFNVTIGEGSATTPATTISVTPTISIDSNGKITASGTATKDVTPTIVEGYVDEGTKGTITANASATKQLTTKSATSYTPSTTDQTIASGTYLTGTQTIKGDANLIASNIKKGVSIFGVTGTSNEGINPSGNINITGTSAVNVTNYATATVSDTDLVATNIKSNVDILGVKGTFTSDGTAVAGDILSGKIAYVNGSKITGSIATKTSSNVTTSGNTVSIPAGYYASAVSKTVGTAKAAATYTPTTSNQTIKAGYYLSGDQTIKGDANLVAANIKSGVSIFGVSGSYYGYEVSRYNYDLNVDNTTDFYQTQDYNILLYISIESNEGYPFDFDMDYHVDGRWYSYYYNSEASTANIIFFIPAGMMAICDDDITNPDWDFIGIPDTINITPYSGYAPNSEIFTFSVISL